MRKLKHSRFPAILILSLLCLMVMCKKEKIKTESDDNQLLKGIIKDTVKNRPLPGVMVVLRVCYTGLINVTCHNIDTFYTDSSGAFFFTRGQANDKTGSNGGVRSLGLVCEHLPEVYLDVSSTHNINPEDFVNGKVLVANPAALVIGEFSKFKANNSCDFYNLDAFSYVNNDSFKNNIITWYGGTPVNNFSVKMVPRSYRLNASYFCANIKGQQQAEMVLKPFDTFYLHTVLHK